MAVLLKPNVRTLDREIDDAAHSEAAAATQPIEAIDYAAIHAEKPGISGINPITLVVVMLMGLVMWAGILYLGYAALSLVF